MKCEYCGEHGRYMEVYQGKLCCAYCKMINEAEDDEELDFEESEL